MKPAIPDRTPYFRASYCWGSELCPHPASGTYRCSRADATPDGKSLALERGVLLDFDVCVLFKISLTPTLFPPRLTNASMSTCTIFCDKSLVASRREIWRIHRMSSRAESTRPRHTISFASFSSFARFACLSSSSFFIESQFRGRQERTRQTFFIKASILLFSCSSLTFSLRKNLEFLLASAMILLTSA